MRNKTLKWECLVENLREAQEFSSAAVFINTRRSPLIKHGFISHVTPFPSVNSHHLHTSNSTFSPQVWAASFSSTFPIQSKCSTPTKPHFIPQKSVAIANSPLPVCQQRRRAAVSHPAVRLEGEDVHPSLRAPEREVPLPAHAGRGGLPGQAGPGGETEGRWERRGRERRGERKGGRRRGRRRGGDGLGERRRERIAGSQSRRREPRRQQLRARARGLWTRKCVWRVKESRVPGDVATLPEVENPLSAMDSRLSSAEPPFRSRRSQFKWLFFLNFIF